jgi:hypothetical protein
MVEKQAKQETIMKLGSAFYLFQAGSLLCLFLEP